MRAGRTSAPYGNQSKVTRTERLVSASSIAIAPASRSQAKARYLVVAADAEFPQLAVGQSNRVAPAHAGTPGKAACATTSWSALRTTGSTRASHGSE